MEYTTIAAVGTPPGRGGVGIVRISGSEAISIVLQIFKSISCRNHSKVQHNTKIANQVHNDKNHSTIKLEPKRLYYGHIFDYQKNILIDEVLVTAMYAPYSYTCEDVVEIQAHGGSVVLNQILELVLDEGARLAKPGEFTRRAFLNGRIDLSQAEGIIDLINAKTEKAAAAAAKIIAGGMQKEIESIKNALLRIIARLEMNLDFPENEDSLANRNEAGADLKRNVSDKIESIISRYEEGRLMRDGLRVLILGKPNVGKSSLLNALTGRERVIVTEFAGTTRDTVEEELNVEGIPVVFIDSAGIHESNDPLEAISMAKTKEAVQDADLVLYMVDIRETKTVADHNILDISEDKPMILTLNKCDLVTKNFKPQLPETLRSNNTVSISAKYKTGLDFLKQNIAQYIRGGGLKDSGVPPNLRQQYALQKCLKFIKKGLSAIEGQLPGEIFAIDLYEAADALGEITGKVSNEDVLEKIFSRFCIGK
jgi:tRNA modification GTPase